jgi:thiol-disulfide isomerase/thioredoxin
MTDEPIVPAPEGPAAPGSGPGRRRLELVLFLAVLVAALAGALVWGRPRPLPDTGLEFRVIRSAPSPAPALALHDLGGGPVRLADFRGRVVLINFWATWCPPCRDEMPAMQTLARELDRQGLVVLAVNYQEGAEAIRQFTGETRFTLPVLLDPDGAVTRRYRVTVLPTSVLVDRRGALVGTVVGFRNWGATEARAYLRGLLASTG